MAERDADRQPNVFGAIVFFSYIIAALAFTCVIVYDLLPLCKARLQASQKAPKGNGSSASRLQASIFLALLSFSALSYHMLSFLIVSYSTWSHDTGSPIPGTAPVPNSHLQIFVNWTRLSIWQWATQSNLFQDFTESILDSPKSYFWTQKALLYSFIWNCYMAETGMRLQIPRLWAYFAIGQILPVSFSQNLFLVARQLRERPGEEGYAEDASPPRNMQLVAVLVTMCYLQCLFVAPETVGSSMLFPTLFVTRLLLLSPFLVVTMSRRKEKTPRVKRRYGPVMFSRNILTLVMSVWMVMERWSLWWPGSIGDAVDALNRNSAVSALGYDLLIGANSLAVYKLLEFV